jgi:hypothetical protein
LSQVFIIENKENHCTSNLKDLPGVLSASSIIDKGPCLNSAQGYASAFKHATYMNFYAIKFATKKPDPLARRNKLCWFYKQSAMSMYNFV